MKTCRKNVGHCYDENDYRQCPFCAKEWRRERYLKHREEELKSNQKWIESNRTRYQEKQKEYKLANPEKVKGWWKAWCAANPAYACWRSMKARCMNPKCHKYSNYGGRGITICSRWLGDDGYKNFESDMGPRPTPRHTIERVDNNGNYGPSNCVWGTKKQQSRNRRDNNLVTINGVTKCVTEWAEIVGIGPMSMKKRVRRWPEAMWLIPKSNGLMRKNPIARLDL